MAKVGIAGALLKIEPHKREAAISHARKEFEKRDFEKRIKEQKQDYEKYASPLQSDERQN